MLHGGEIYHDRKIEYDFSVNVNPLGFPETVRDCLREAMPMLQQYPDQDCTLLREALSGFTGVPADRILCGNGASELIMAAVRAIRPEKVLITAPAFSSYRRAAESAGADVIEHLLQREEGLALTERFLEDLGKDPDMVILCSPSNPVGNMIDPGLLSRIAEICALRGIWLMVDECFLCFTKEEEARTMRRATGGKNGKKLLVLDAFTKRFAMPGVRLGYLMAGDPLILDRIRLQQPEWSVSVPAQIAGLAALKDCASYLEKTVRLVAKERERMAGELAALGFRVYPGEANYVFFSAREPGPRSEGPGTEGPGFKGPGIEGTESEGTGAGLQGIDLVKELIRRRILIRDCENYSGLGRGDYRAAVRLAEENTVLLQAVREIVTGRKAHTCETEAGAGRERAFPRLMIAAPGSGSGKTLVTCGLLRLLQRNGLRPAAFKCGPDYIDPMFHRQVLGVPSRNLDTYFSPDGAVSDILANAMRSSGAELAVIEGVMGYYDGTGRSGMEASSCDLAVQTGTPVILVVNARGMSRSVIPLIKGFAEYRPRMGSAGEPADHRTDRVGPGGSASRPAEQSAERRAVSDSRIRGVILNGVSSGMAALMKSWIEEETGLAVIGSLPTDPAFSLESRHPGLLQPEEIEDLNDKIDRLADLFEKTIDLNSLLRIAGDVKPAPAAQRGAGTVQERTGKPCGLPKKGPRIAVARDEAFSFYYEDNLELLRECGAELVFFSPLRGRELPDCDGLLLGGGYPELHAKELASNTAIKEQIRAQARAGMPILAECGGFMYLQEYLEVQAGVPADMSEGGSRAGQGIRYEMCGVLPGTCRKSGRLVRFGYMELEGKETGPSGYLAPGHRIRGHEFHYFDSTDNGGACVARKPGRNTSWECMAVQGNIMAGFPHLYYRSDPAFAKNFVDRCKERWLQRQ